MKIVHHIANGRFDCLISEYQSDNPWREVISMGNTKDLRLSILWCGYYFLRFLCFHTQTHLILHAPISAELCLRILIKSYAGCLKKFVITQHTPKTSFWIHLLDVQGVGAYLFSIDFLFLTVQDYHS